VSNYVTQRRSSGRAFHLTRSAQGAWTKIEIPVALDAFGRSQIVLDQADNAYVVLPFGRIVTASKASGWTDWTLRFDAAALGAFGEVVVDRDRVASDGVLSILYQRTSSGTTPSPIHVIDLRLDVGSLQATRTNANAVAGQPIVTRGIDATWDAPQPGVSADENGVVVMRYAFTHVPRRPSPASSAP
jgi:hypothetical protein